MPITKDEIQRLAQVSLGPDAKLFNLSIRDAGQRQHWFGLAVAGRIIGCRRSLNELPQLIQRGHAMDCLGKTPPPIPQKNSTLR